MGYWGVKSFENDESHDALDSAFEQVHGRAFEDLMDDRNPLSPEQVFRKLADPETLTVSLAILDEEFGDDREAWDEIERLALVGIVVLHAEADVPIPLALRDLAIDWLEHEAIDWDEATRRRLRRDRELEALKRANLATD